MCSSDLYFVNSIADFDHSAVSVHGDLCVSVCTCIVHYVHFFSSDCSFFFLLGWPYWSSSGKVPSHPLHCFSSGYMVVCVFSQKSGGGLGLASLLKNLTGSRRRYIVCMYNQAIQPFFLSLTGSRRRYIVCMYNQAIQPFFLSLTGSRRRYIVCMYNQAIQPFFLSMTGFRRRYIVCMYNQAIQPFFLSLTGSRRRYIVCMYNQAIQPFFLSLTGSRRRYIVCMYTVRPA